MKDRPGLTARLVRERVTDPVLGPNTYLKVVNMYPSGDFSTTLFSTPRNLITTPNLHFDYRFEPGTQVNLYVRRSNVWFEFLMTGKEAQEQNVYTAGKLPVVADGQWHHLAADLGSMLTAAVAKQSGTAPTDLSIQEDHHRGLEHRQRCAVLRLRQQRRRLKRSASTTSRCCRRSPGR